MIASRCLRDTVSKNLGIWLAVFVLSSGCGPKLDNEPTETEDREADAGALDSGLGTDDAGPGESDSETQTDSSPPTSERCETLSEAMGALFCTNDIPDAETFEALSLRSTGTDTGRLTKYLFSVDPEFPVPLTFMNVNLHRLHYDFLVEAYPELFVGVSPVAYLRMATEAPRRLLVGSIAEHWVDDEMVYGFTVVDDPSEGGLVLSAAEVTLLYETFAAQLALRPLFFVPETAAQLAAAAWWLDEIPVLGKAPVTYEVYTEGVGFGTVRIMDLRTLQLALLEGRIGYQDIVVLDEAPSDLTTVVSGAVTGTRQGILSHLNVRSAARGTPNCYIPDPRETLAELDGELVRLSCGAEALTVEVTTLEAAEAGWAALRPAPVALRPPDLESRSLRPLLDIPTGTPAERAAAIDAIGAKAANLAALYQRIDARLQYPGFAVPFAYSDRFMTENRFEAETAGGTERLSFAEAIDTWLSEDDFQTDTALRRARLGALQRAMAAAPVDASLLDAIAAAVQEVFGDPSVMVRFRSSSNAEDSLQFSGAGLYDSTSACVADGLDSDSAGPSRCDPDKKNEEDVAAALKQVWASLWNPGAFEEREWYGIDHRQVRMGVLVNSRTKGEQANIVAFTGHPVSGDNDYLVNAQLGEWDVVASDPGIFPETTVLKMSEGGVDEIVRQRPSSQAAPGSVVLSDVLLGALGAHLLDIESVYPVDVAEESAQTVFLDTEWKLTESGALIIKQVRPFLFTP